MRLLEDIGSARTWRAESPARVGLVPTMGYLHDGHLSLVRSAREGCDRVVASIFVNPAQFDRAGDLEGYPRDLARDRDLLDAAGCNALFLPSPEVMYPQGFDTWVEPGAVARGQEGLHRPGHFRGVATVVLKLINIVQPSAVYFGDKDAQQLAVIRALVRDFDVATSIVPVATAREADGLALSSRNVRLSEPERRAAAALHAALFAAEQDFCRGERRSSALLAAVRRVLDQEPLARTDYVDVADPDTMGALDLVESRGLVSLAVWIGGTRLIDNVILDVRQSGRAAEAFCS